MKNALILHGAGNTSQGNWFPWLKSELEEAQFEVWSPDLPNSDYPDKESWLKTVFQSDFSFNDQTILIGHSSGATLILRILERLPKNSKIHKAILVATPVELGSKPEYFQYKKSLVVDDFNWLKIKNSAQSFYFIHSNNDQYDCGESQGELLHKNLGGELIVQKGEGHFNLEAGDKYAQFPLALELCLK